MPSKEFSLVFYFPEFISNTPLNTKNILEYFALSPFYDNYSINQIFLMQSRFTQINIDSFMKSTEGICFEAELVCENLFVIQKKRNEKKSGSEEIISNTIAIYYCMHGYIYRAPSLSQVEEKNSVTMLYYLDKCLDFYQSNVSYNFLCGPVLEKKDNTSYRDRNKLLLEALSKFLGISAVF